ncbi:response regulator transcription factor [Hymenobacter koreensis]|uniref:Response regulator transcription factor n=1 Tax=Hymenobacter koreensis TaxID=1084523 RepID=A0ABP8IUT3_9BACT
MNQTAIQVLLIDDHPMVVEGIKTLLRHESGVQVVGQASSDADALRCLHALPHVQVVLLGLNQPGPAGPELIRSLRAVAPQARVLALSVFHDPRFVTEVLEAGGAGYILKSSSREELIDAIRSVADGRTYFSPEIGATLLQNLHFPAANADVREVRPVELTTREKQILQLIAQEYSNSLIAETLFISERTVETHRKNILTKTNSKSVVGLIQYAFRNKLIR